MKLLVLACAALLSSCALGKPAVPLSPRMAVAYGDLRLETSAGRAALVQRVARAARDFCRAYDPMDPEAIFDVRLASARLCPEAAATLLSRQMPMAIRRAYRTGVRERSLGGTGGN